MKINVKQLKVCIEETRDIAQKLLVSYGASILKSKIRVLPSKLDFANTKVEVNQKK